MGLDQFAYSLPTDNARSEVDFDIDAVPKNERKQIHHWRAHFNLDVWMAELYRQKDGDDDDFDQSSLLLTLEDINELERAIVADDLPYMSGLNNAERREDDLEFIRKTREEFAKGRTIAYYAWW